MHSPILRPAGKGKSLTFTDDTAYVQAKIVDRDAITLIDEEVYKGLSIGILDPPIIPDPTAKGGRIGFKGGGGFINEVSLVDVPANPRALFTVAKRATRGARIEPGSQVSVEIDGEMVPVTHRQLTKAFVASLSAGADDPGALAKALSKVSDTEMKCHAWDRAIAKPMQEAQEERSSKKGLVTKAALSDEMKSKFSSMLKKDSTSDVTSLLRRCNQWASSGHYPYDMSYSDLRWVASQCVKELNRRDPESEASMDDFPGAKSTKKKGKGSTVDEIGKAARPKGARKCRKCKGTGFMGEEDMKCDKCKGQGWVLPDKDGTKTRKGGEAADVGKGAEGATADKGADAPDSTKGTKAKKPPDFESDDDDDDDGDDDKGKSKAGKAVAQSDLTKAAQQVRAARAGSRSIIRVARALTKSGDPDSDVDAAIADIMEGIGVAADAQAADEAGESGKPSDGPVSQALADAGEAVGDLAAAQAQDEAAGEAGRDRDDDKGRKKVKAGKRAKNRPQPADAGAHDDDYDDGRDNRDVVDDGSTSARKRSGKRAKAGKRDGIEPGELVLHDLLCPAYTAKSVRKAYDLGSELPVPEVVSPDYFAGQLAQASQIGKRNQRESQVQTALDAFTAATHLATLEPQSFLQLREAAHKGFTDAYPDVRLKPGLINPEQFRRPFLSSATPEVGRSTRVPLPDLRESLTPKDFRRPPLTTNETRPTLSGGESVALKGGTRGADNPNFYGAATSEAAMSILHDSIATRNPGVCPMHPVQPGTDLDRDGLAGSPAEMQAHGPGTATFPTPPGAAVGGTVRQVGKGKAGEPEGGGATQVVTAEVLAEVDRRVERITKGYDRKVGKLKKRLRRQGRELAKALRAPDPTQRAHLGTSPRQFRPTVDEPTSDGARALRKAQERTAVLKGRLRDPNSTISAAASEQLRQDLSPEEYARVAVGDD